MVKAGVMGRHTWHRSSARGRTVSAARSEDEAIARLWGIESCERCGRTIVLGEQSVRLAVGGRRTVVCPECLEPASAVPTWIAAPARLSLEPVLLTASRTEESVAA